MSRCRNSSRCSTRVASSSRGSRRVRIRPISVDGGLARCRLGEGGLVAGDGVLELPHAATEGAADLRQPLRAEEQEREPKQDDEVRWGGPADHAFTSWIEMS